MSCIGSFFYDTVRNDSAVAQIVDVQGVLGCGGNAVARGYSYTSDGAVPQTGWVLILGPQIASPAVRTWPTTVTMTRELGHGT